MTACAAAAAGDRTLDLYNMNTGESLSVTYKRDGRWNKEALAKLDWFLRDWRKGESIKMDRRLYDLIWEIREQAGTKAPIHVHSGYRSQSTNSMLRKKSKAVAKHSQHVKGTAIDFHIPGISARTLREIALRMQNGGVGYYPEANNPFIHVDVAEVRHWPRMSRQQLAALFPDGLTAYIPSDGKPLKGFREALAMIKAGKRPGTPASILARLDPEEIPVPSSRPKPPAASVNVPSRAFAALGLEPRQETEEHHFSGITAYLPSQSGSASRTFMSPSQTVPASMAAIRKPLDSPKEAAQEARRIKPGPVFIDMGVGKKGDRLVKSGGRRQPVKWTIGGVL